MRNQSEIVDLMYGQYRSIVDCPQCNKHSIQFDPFLMCQLPITNNSQKKIELKFVHEHFYATKITICYEKNWNWSMTDVMNEIKKKMDIDTNAELVCYVASYASCELINGKRNAD